MNKNFGTDGVRGKVNVEITVDLALKVGKSLKLLNGHKLVIGYDTRISNKMLTSAIIAGALSQNIEIEEKGIVSTPIIQFYSQTYHCIGIMISASHNPFYDNGIKIFNDGKKLNIEERNLIETYIDLANDILSYDDYNAIYTYNDDISSYLDSFSGLLEPTCLSIGLDLANGSYSNIAPLIYKNITNQLFLTGNKPNGVNINDMVGSTSIAHLIRVVKENALDLGFSFDGDGDRLVCVAKDGTVYDGDKLIYIIAKYFKYPSVVLTKISNHGVVESFEKENIQVIISDVGDYNVYQLMQKNNCFLGGEASGHIIASQFSNTGDGLLISLLILKILNQTKKTLKELTHNLIEYPDKTVNLPTKDKKIADSLIIKEMVSKINSELGKNGKFLIRASGTEPFIRVYCCAREETQVDNYIGQAIFLLNKLENSHER